MPHSLRRFARMEAALAEFRAEDVGLDVEDDVDFIVEKGRYFFTLRLHHLIAALSCKCRRRRCIRVRF